MRQSGLAGAVGRAQRRGAHRRDRGDVDDRPAAMLAHQGRRRLGAEKGPGEIDFQDPAPVRVGSFEQRREHRDAGIVDERVEPAEPPRHLGHRRRHAAGIGNVASQRQRVVGVGESSDRALQQFALDIEQRHAPAFGQEAFRRRQPDAACGAGDECDLLQGRLQGRGHGGIRCQCCFNAVFLARGRSVCFAAPRASGGRKGVLP